MITRKELSAVLLLLFLILWSAGCSSSKPTTPKSTVPKTTAKVTSLTLATTTSTQDSGLLDELIPAFEKKYPYKVKTVAVGSGAALAMGEKGDADVLLVHAPADEKKLVDAGVATNYRLVMHNDFILVGPPADPAGVKTVKTSVEALKLIANKGNLFVSRGDDSGTNKAELKLWKAAGITPPKASYQETGAGVGQTLTVASQKGAYTLTDRATYLAQKQNLKLDIVLQGEKSLLNIYHVMQVNPKKFPKVNAQGAKDFVTFMTAPDTQKMIGKFGAAKYGEPLFFPDAGKSEADLTK